MRPAMRSAFPATSPTGKSNWARAMRSDWVMSTTFCWTPRAAGSWFDRQRAHATVAAGGAAIQGFIIPEAHCMGACRRATPTTTSICGEACAVQQRTATTAFPQPHGRKNSGSVAERLGQRLVGLALDLVAGHRRDHFQLHNLVAIGLPRQAA